MQILPIMQRFDSILRSTESDPFFYKFFQIRYTELTVPFIFIKDKIFPERDKDYDDYLCFNADVDVYIDVLTQERGEHLYSRVVTAVCGLDVGEYPQEKEDRVFVSLDYKKIVFLITLKIFQFLQENLSIIVGDSESLLIVFCLCIIFLFLRKLLEGILSFVGVALGRRLILCLVK